VIPARHSLKLEFSPKPASPCPTSGSIKTPKTARRLCG
jgi:hypothetical protein